MFGFVFLWNFEMHFCLSMYLYVLWKLFEKKEKSKATFTSTCARRSISFFAITLFLFYKNHVFQNEAGLFLIFSKIWGSIVLNLFLNYILKNDNEKINRKYHFYILFSQKLYSSSNIEGSIILLFPLLIQFLHFFLNFLLFFFLKFEARCS